VSLGLPSRPELVPASRAVSMLTFFIYLFIYWLF
jgi:hypothetical protein